MKLSTRFLRLVLLSTGLLSLAHSGRADIPAPPLLVLSSQPDGTQAENLFSCSGTIHGYITLPQPVAGKHTLEGIWTGPRGTVIQHTRQVIDIPPPGRRMATLWLDFSREGGGWWNPVSVQEPRDADHLKYDGPWRIDIRWDDRPLAQQTFNVRCLD